MVAGPVRVARKESNCALVVYLKHGPILSGSFVAIVVFIPGFVRLKVPYVPNQLNVTGRKNCAE